MKLKFDTEPWKHQLEALQYLMPRNYGALYTDMGSGKTKVMIDLIVNKGFGKTIIVATSKICRRNVWPSEIQIHAFNTPILILNLVNISGNKRLSYINSNSRNGKIEQEIMIVNYESIWREPLKSFLLKKYKPDCVICDESHKIKTPGSKVSRFLQQLGKVTPNRYLMTGTPLAQSPLDIYAQYRFLNPEIFGTRFQDFKDTYANWIRVPGGYSIIDKNRPYKNLDILHHKMFSCAFTCENLDLNLPPTQDILVEFDLSKEAQKQYRELKKEGCLELEEGVLEAGNILTTITRLQQLTSGYVPVETDNNEKVFVEIDNSRQETLKELLECIPEEEPVVVFAKFRKDINNIRKVVKSLGRKSSELSGRKDTTQNWVDGKTKVLVIQISSGAEGLNELVKARYCIYYTLTHSLGQYLQSRKRVHRPGQTKSVIYYTLIAKMDKLKTIDEIMLEGLKNNKDIIDYIMSNKEI